MEMRKTRKMEMKKSKMKKNVSREKQDYSIS